MKTFFFLFNMKLFGNPEAVIEITSSTQYKVHWLCLNGSKRYTIFGLKIGVKTVS